MEHMASRLQTSTIRGIIESNETITVSTQTLTSGMYMLKVIDPQGMVIHTQKISIID
jgi:hypothetical protein